MKQKVDLKDTKNKNKNKKKKNKQTRTQINGRFNDLI
jgi:hypothetical protein